MDSGQLIIRLWIVKIGILQNLKGTNYSNWRNTFSTEANVAGHCASTPLDQGGRMNALYQEESKGFRSLIRSPSVEAPKVFWLVQLSHTTGSQTCYKRGWRDWWKNEMCTHTCWLFLCARGIVAEPLSILSGHPARVPETVFMKIHYFPPLTSGNAATIMDQHSQW